MLQRIHDRLNRDEKGFTLIELMVVVLIIAILIAIAIPTFLGARKRAQDKQAQSNLRNALTAEKTYYVDHQDYASVAGADLTDLQAIESSLVWTSNDAATRGVTVDDPTAVGTSDSYAILESLSKSGVLFCLMDVATATATHTPGTYFAKDTAGSACPAETGTWSLDANAGW